MAFGDVFRSKTFLGTDVASKTEELLATVTAKNASPGVLSTTSASYVDFSTASQAITVATGETVIVSFKTNFSHADATGTVRFRILRDATPLGQTNYGYVTGVASTGGKIGTVNLIHSDTPGSGSFTYKAQWLSAANTAYAEIWELELVQLRVS